MSYPYYIDRESEYAKDLPVGTRVVGDWGAMWPNNYGTITEFNSERQLHLVEWDNADPETEAWYEIRLTRSANGSPIGVWVDG